MQTTTKFKIVYDFVSVCVLCLFICTFLKIRILDKELYISNPKYCLTDFTESFKVVKTKIIFY